MHIGKLASELGISAQAVRFYERSGLLNEPARTDSGYRQYGPNDLKRLRFIRQAKELGFTLPEIGSMLRMHDAGHAPCAEVIAIAQRHLDEVEAEIHRLQRFRRQLSSALTEWRKVKTRQVAGSAICELIERTFANHNVGPRASRELSPNGRKASPQRAPSPAANSRLMAGVR